MYQPMYCRYFPAFSMKYVTHITWNAKYLTTKNTDNYSLVVINYFLTEWPMRKYFLVNNLNDLSSTLFLRRLEFVGFDITTLEILSFFLIVDKILLKDVR